MYIGGGIFNLLNIATLQPGVMSLARKYLDKPMNHEQCMLFCHINLFHLCQEIATNVVRAI